MSDGLKRFGIAGGGGAISCLVAWCLVAPLYGLLAAWGPSMAVMGLASLVGVSAGFLMLALLPSRSHAVVAILTSILLMFLFGSLASPLRPTGGAGPVADTLPSRWAFEALLVLEAASASADGEAPHPDVAETAFPAASTRSGLRACVLALGLFTVGLGGAAAFIAWGPGVRPRTPQPAPAEIPR